MVFATTIPCIGEDEFVGIHYSIVVVKPPRPEGRGFPVRKIDIFV
jgi:hypothetical protein